MGKLGTGSVIAGAIAAANATCALATTSSCALVWGIEEPIPTAEDGGPADVGATGDAPGDDASSDDRGSASDAPDSATDDSTTDGATLDAADAGDAGAPGYTSSLPTPVPAFLDACSLPGHASFFQTTHDNASVSGLSLPFPFPFYGSSEANYWVNTNGVMGFGLSSSNIPTLMCPLPDTLFDPHPAIYAFGDDLSTRAGVCVASTGSSPGRQLVVTWEDAMFSVSMSGHLTFSVVLTETANTIDLLYETMTGGSEAEGDQATIGMEDSTGMSFTEFSCRTAVITRTPLDVRFTPTP
jgi:hypothetical protein